MVQGQQVDLPLFGVSLRQNSLFKLAPPLTLSRGLLHSSVVLDESQSCLIRLEHVRWVVGVERWVAAGEH